ncbi:MAG: N-acetyl-gamma-glutamyl-phosphate reductase [Bacteroidota bacterium]
MIKAGIIGAAGYTAGELMRILLNHPEVEIVLAQSESQAGKWVAEIHTDLFGAIDLVFRSEINAEDLDVVFLCKGHGESNEILKLYPELLNKKIIDLSQDFRLEGDHDFIYGLPEANYSKIKSADHVANPGCFATAIQLALLPVFKEKSVKDSVHISGITGSTGAGYSLSSTTHFSWRSNNASVYKPLTHQHLNEVGETLKSFYSSFNKKINFVPYRGAFTRGIITTSHFETDLTEEELTTIYEAYYSFHPFTYQTKTNPDLKMVVNSNKCLVFPQVIHGTALIISVIDNLLKGASGQAVQNMNLMFGFEEITGLQLKTSAF